MNACCDVQADRELVERRKANPPPGIPNAKIDLVITRCKTCGRQHYELSVDPVPLGVKL
jgi:hypothetical protein